MICIFQFAKCIEQADQDFIGKGVHPGIHLGGLFCWHVRIHVNLDNRLNQCISKE